MSVDKSGDRIQQMFASIADRYDRMNHLLSLNIDRYWRWWTVRKVAPRGAAPILDVCTGTGDLALAYWRAAHGNLRVIGADFCRPMLEIGRKKKAEAGINGTLEFVEADTQNLPFPDNCFQIVSVAFGLRNVSDTMAGLREMFRVCEPWGRIAILEFSSPRLWPWRSVYNWYFRTVLPRVGQFFARNDHAAYAYLPTSVGQFPDGPALANRLTEVGLDGVEYFPLTLGVATLYVGTKPKPNRTSS
jgi:demethylmenaquinone methyltransferase/2-methoxy-6-polyprenyl-1,4-benzoquinol methylase